MTGERDLPRLLAGASPRLLPAEYVFVTVAADRVGDIPARARIEEDEGTTLVIERADADARGLSYEFVARWITLDVQSALDAIGLTAAFGTALAVAGISCNVLAGYHHDHLLVPAEDAHTAVEVLEQLSP
ncbi:ACT domain-containing protein [Aldersonia sp. NBC_00410]|uniref:ACT domain-containing protein n=1 Tax=Aldersonia sp. NBC_00410 TaxID=2975954 RepID=UPI0022593D62|nr:ACT domain-containing protein [Aldersonia sp. NBC_00410]MCX5045208.1 ACT domain-containing protein [Aldersonia sp. NBC_00410]